MSLSLRSIPSWAQRQEGGLRHGLSELGNTEARAGEICLLPTPQAKYDSLMELVGQAHRYVHLEYFWIADDSIGRQLIDLLERKAGEGVEVRVIIDGFANHKSEASWTRQRLDTLRTRGVNTMLFDPFRFPWLNHVGHRDHRKIAVVDGKAVVTGGMNVADYYLHGTPRTGTWRDMHMEMRGSVVDVYERVFERMWTKLTGEALDTTLYRHPPAGHEGYTPVTVVSREPHALSRRMREAYAESIDSARHEVRIVNPYLTNVRMVRKALRRALGRGVRVMVMTSVKSDVRTVPELVAVEMTKLMRRGAEVYYYEGGFHHGKVMTLDGETSTVGTANLDGRSLRCDYEINAFIHDPQVTQQLEAIFDDDVLDSQLMTHGYLRRHFTLGQRMKARILSPLKGLF